jgi:hypothetical protein
MLVAIPNQAGSRAMQTRLTFVTAVAAAVLLTLSGGAGAQDGQDAQALRNKHQALKTALAESPFKRPVVLQADSAKSAAPQGHVYAVIEHPYAAVKAALQRPGSWCDVLILQHNIKRCLPSGNNLQVAIGRKHDQPIEDTFQVDFRYALRAATNEHLSVQLAADQGPLGTSNYRLSFQAVPIDGRHTFVHMAYAYEAGMAARVATDAYLATKGRAKVGFSKSSDGSYVGGVQGVAERNTMRYYLAIEAFLDSLSVPEGQRAEKRLRDWFAATERHPQQLREMEQGEYLAMKRREIQQTRPVAAAIKDPTL